MKLKTLFMVTTVALITVLSQASFADQLAFSKEELKQLRMPVAKVLLCARDIAEDGINGPERSVLAAAAILESMRKIIQKRNNKELDQLHSKCVSFRDEARKSGTTLNQHLQNLRPQYGVTSASLKEEAIEFRGKQVAALAALKLEKDTIGTFAVNFVAPMYYCLGARAGLNIGAVVFATVSGKGYVCIGNNGRAAFIAAADGGGGAGVHFLMAGHVEAAYLQVRRISLPEEIGFLTYTDSTLHASGYFGFGVSGSYTDSRLDTFSGAKSAEMLTSQGASIGVAFGEIGISFSRNDSMGLMPSIKLSSKSQLRIMAEIASDEFFQAMLIAKSITNDLSKP
jgi:hypothetical protein